MRSIRLTGTVMTINTKKKKHTAKTAVKSWSISQAPHAAKWNCAKAGGSYAVVFGKSCRPLLVKPLVEVSPHLRQLKVVSQTAVSPLLRKSSTQTPSVWQKAKLPTPFRRACEGEHCRFTGHHRPHDCTELEAMAATVISPSVDGAYRQASHSVGLDRKAEANTPRLMKFMHDFGLVTARDQRCLSFHDRRNP